MRLLGGAGSWRLLPPCSGGVPGRSWHGYEWNGGKSWRKALGLWCEARDGGGVDPGRIRVSSWSDDSRTARLSASFGLVCGKGRGVGCEAFVVV
ncbi:hypothetical protein E2562_011742 [Oryza meyeriana var. granulata]|uniref:Uncharacterized protein n=1 Tax=Oryza meyeriana var. granulata TaxID=110450 RepID=A0A6G1DH43_9ORYZ|nr:hypothetical protein E2562_011742 [Oryza meyeriana var. granulata]